MTRLFLWCGAAVVVLCVTLHWILGLELRSRARVIYIEGESILEGVKEHKRRIGLFPVELAELTRSGSALTLADGWRWHWTATGCELRIGIGSAYRVAVLEFDLSRSTQWKYQEYRDAAEYWDSCFRIEPKQNGVPQLSGIVSELRHRIDSARVTVGASHLEAHCKGLVAWLFVAGEFDEMAIVLARMNQEHICPEWTQSWIGRAEVLSAWPEKSQPALLGALADSGDELLCMCIARQLVLSGDRVRYREVLQLGRSFDRRRLSGDAVDALRAHIFDVVHYCAREGLTDVASDWTHLSRNFDSDSMYFELSLAIERLLKGEWKRSMQFAQRVMSSWSSPIRFRSAAQELHRWAEKREPPIDWDFLPRVRSALVWEYQ